MKSSTKKITTAILSSVSCLCIGIGVTLLPKVVVADDTASQTTAEWLANQSLVNAEDATLVEIKSYSKRITDDKYNQGLINAWESKQYASISTNTTSLTTGNTYNANFSGEMNPNVDGYEGNFGFFTTCGTIRPNFTTDSANDIFSYRTKYDSTYSVTNSARANGMNAWGKSHRGYVFETCNNTLTIGYAEDSKDAFAGTFATYSISGVSNGDNVIVSYGAVELNDTTLRLYFSLADENGDEILTAVYDDTEASTRLENTTYYGSNFVIRLARTRGYIESNSETSYASMLLAGVNRPMLSSNTYDYTVSESYADGTTLSEVQLPAGYAWKDDAQTVALGENTYEAVYTSSNAYYGGYEKYNCDITVTGDLSVWLARQTLVNAEDATLVEIKSYNKRITADSYNQGLVNAWDSKQYASISTNTTSLTTGNTYNANFAGEMNPNVDGYEGNFGFFTTCGTIRPNFTTDSANDIFSYRTKYDSTYSVTNSARANGMNAWGKSHRGYVFETCGNTLTLGYAEDAKGDFTGTFATYSISGVSNGDNVIVSYGAVELNDTTLRLYFSLADENGDEILTAVYDDTEASTRLENTTYYGSNFVIRLARTRGYLEGNNETSYASMLLAGVNRPMLSSNTYDYTVSDNYAEGTSLSDITLPAGYTLKNANAEEVAYGTNAYAGTYTYAYYGGVKTVDCTISVTGTGERSTVSFVDSDGVKVLEDVIVKPGEKTTLPTYTDSALAQFVGWFVGEDLYSAGSQVTVNTDMEIVLAELSLDIEDGAFIRFTDEGGYYGMRFLVSVNTAQLTKLGNKAVFKGLYAPTDQIDANEGFVASMTGAKEFITLSQTYVDGDYTYAYISMTDILYSNFNREFSARGAVEVTYSDGTANQIFYTDYDEEINSVSPMEVVKLGIESDIYTATEKQIALGLYVNSVVELTVNKAGESLNFAVVDYEDGYEIDRSYTIQSQSAVSNGDGSYNVTLQIALDVADNLYTAGNVPKIPVTVYDAENGYAMTRIVRPTITSYLDGVATIEFVWVEV